MKRFGKVWCASGARGFFGEGYWFHKFVPGLDWEGSTFVAKTTTLEKRVGNLPLKENWMPKAFFPPCIKVNPFGGYALNAVGLSGPGISALLDTERWQKRTKPFFISFMPVTATKGDRTREVLSFCYVIQNVSFQADIGIQINLSCPNTEHDQFIQEAKGWIDNIRRARPDALLVAKINVFFPIEDALSLEVDGICVSNALPWGSPGIDWKKLFGSRESPLKHLGGGGLSGAPLLSMVAAWIAVARDEGYEGHINGCGGILSVDDAKLMFAAGADSISLGTIAMLRGWRLRKVIASA